MAPGGGEQHPILVRDLVRRDGGHALSFRIYCARQSASQPLSACAVCPRRHEALDDPDAGTGGIRCDATSDAALVQRLAVGNALHESLTCVTTDTSASDVIKLMVDRSLTIVFVVDPKGRLAGAIRDADLLRPVRRIAPRGVDESSTDTRAADIMRAAIAVQEDETVAAALARMASSHLREIAVVTRNDELVGVLRDVEGLRFVAAHRGDT